MPASFVIDHDRRVVRSRAWGVLVEQDLAASQQALRSDKQFDPMYSQIWDFGEVKEVGLTGSQIQSLVLNSPFSPRARRALVVNSDVAYGMARMYALMGDRDPECFRVFRDRESALRWLGKADDLRSEKTEASEPVTRASR